eukprot:TRINITY_DN2901_c0_g1_i3.p1 TRINITY_DN2901_c0_g1~~TRINITY_DN2901_c0_g1_i3.p1  ORF type:complete len:537 (+),score=82.26 TRINITY_DN2901_c0_g1_i3:157-1767(+)
MDFMCLDYGYSVNHFDTHSTCLGLYQDLYKKRVKDGYLLENHVFNALSSSEISDFLFDECSSDRELKEKFQKVASVTSFIDTIATTLENNSHVINKKIKTLVIGGGPIGLIHALVAHSYGSEVIVVEKRNTYSRNIWFDVGPDIWYPSIQYLRSFGFFYQDIEYQESDMNGSPIYTIRCQILERFLLKVLAFASIEYTIGTFLRICNDTHNYYGLISLSNTSSNIQNHGLTCNSDAGIKKIPFDILIGADGSKSTVRDIFSIEYKKYNGFYINNIVYKNFKDIHQVTMLVEFKSNNLKKCKKLNTYDDGTPYDYIHPSYFIPGVTSVFKRWFYGFCHLQILFSNEMGAELLKEDNNATNILFYTVNLIFENKYSNIEDMLDDINNGRDGILIHQIDINRAKKPGIVTGNDNNYASVFLVGDSLVSAHYRLGVGINNGFLSLVEFSTFLREIANISSRNQLEACVRKKNKKARKRSKQLVQFELSTIYYEAYCDYVVTVESDSKEYDDLIIWKKDKNPGELTIVPDSEILQIGLWGM